MTIVPVEPTAIVPPRHSHLRFTDGELPPSRNPYLVLLGTRTSHETIQATRGDLDLIAEIISPTRDPDANPKGSGKTLAWWVLRYEDTAMIRARLLARPKAAPASVNRRLSSLRQVLATTWRLGHMTAEDYHAAADVKNVKGERALAGRNLAGTEITAMLTACLRDIRPHGCRDAAIIAVLAATGMRRAEVAGLLVEHLDTAERFWRVLGKGNKERDVPVHEAALGYAEPWLAFTGAKDGYAFPPLGRWGKPGPGPMQPLEIGRIVDRRRQEAGLRPMTAHDFRRTFAGDMLDIPGVDVVTVQRILGHASVATTGKYDRRPARGRRAAVDKLTLPSATELGGRVDQPAPFAAGTEAV